MEIFGVRQKQTDPFLFYVSRIISPGYGHLSITQGHKKNKKFLKKVLTNTDPRSKMLLFPMELSRTLDLFGYADDFGKIGNNSMTDYCKLSLLFLYYSKRLLIYGQHTN